MSDQPDQPDRPTGPADLEPGPVGEATQLSVLPTPRPERTGVPEVDAALDRLDEIDPSSTDLEQQVEAYEDVHARLQEALGPTDSD